MLGVRLESTVEVALENYAHAIGRSKSAIVRDLIVRHLEIHAIDAQMQRAVRVANATDRTEDDMKADMTIWDD